MHHDQRTAEETIETLLTTTDRQLLLASWFKAIDLGIDAVLVGQHVSEHELELRVIPVDIAFFARWIELTEDAPLDQAA